MKIAVFGDLILDHYILGSTSRLSPEAPIPVVNVSSNKYILGGACNVVRNLSTFGCDVIVFGHVGDDTEGKLLRDMLVDLGVDDSGVVYADTPTTLKSRVQVGSQQIVRLDREEIFNLHGELLAKVIQILSGVISNLDAIILSDYSKGFLSNSLIEGVISKAYERGVPVIADPKGINFERYRGVEFLTPNKIEAEQATGIKILDDYSLELALEALKNIQETDVSIITLGSEGIALSEGGKVQIFPALSSEVFDVTGAGDTVIASMAYGLCLGWSLSDIVKFANKAASIVVKKFGSATASLHEINQLDKNSSKRLLYFDEFMNKDILSSLDKLNVVFTNGVFDILHAGHVRYLQKARGVGDFLIVGVKSDQSVKRLKGENQPINNEAYRAEVLLGLSAVDLVIVFNEDTPNELIQFIRPNKLVNECD